LSHELGRVDLGSRGNDLGLSDSLLRSSGREGLLKLNREVDVLEQDRLDGHTPLLGGGLDLRVSDSLRGLARTLTISATS
jgi:hypothetical protein